MITPFLICLKIPRKEISPLALLLFVLTFYGSWNFRFLGRNGIARLSGMTANYFSMILF